MVSYEELIYNFVDGYLQTAMECSICKENYNMCDDTVFLDSYMKFFQALLLSVDNDPDLEISDIRDTLEKRKQAELISFQTFLRRKAVEAAIESAKALEDPGGSVPDQEVYIKEINRFYTNIFDEESEALKESPIKLLRHMRQQEEKL
jgi:hypothetical protein